MAFTLEAAVAYLKAHRPSVSDAVIAVRATEIYRGYEGVRPHDSVSRSLTTMTRLGSLRGKGLSGAKVRAIWQAMKKLDLVPQLPAEIAASKRVRLGRPAAESPEYWHDKYVALERRIYGESREEVKEVPMLTQPMLRWFGFAKNPVFDEMESERDVWWGPQHREAKAVLVDAAEHSKFLRLAGPRGSGKSLVATAAKADLARREDLILVEPSPTITGVLTETHLITSIIQAVKRKVDQRDEIYHEPQSPARRALAMVYLLKQQKKHGRKVALWIDEAHELKAGTFLALKRFLDEVDGLGRRLLGVVLIGQNPEAAYNPRTRDLSEVSLRLQTYRMQAMNEQIPEYLKFKIERAGARLSDVITPSGVKAIAARCPYPLDANALFAQLLIQAYEDKEKPIGRDDVEAALPEALAEAGS